MIRKLFNIIVMVGYEIGAASAISIYGTLLLCAMILTTGFMIDGIQTGWIDLFAALACLLAFALGRVSKNFENK